MKSAALLLLLVLAGCSSPSSLPKNGSAAKAPDQRVVIDPALQGIVRVREVRDQPPTMGLIRFQVNVENLSAKATTILYQVDWLDKDGASIGLIYDEPPCTMFPHEVVPVFIASPAAVAKDFRLTIRPRVK